MTFCWSLLWISSSTICPSLPRSISSKCPSSRPDFWRSALKGEQVRKIIENGALQFLYSQRLGLLLEPLHLLPKHRDDLFRGRRLVSGGLELVTERGQGAFVCGRGAESLGRPVRPDLSQVSRKNLYVKERPVHPFLTGVPGAVGGFLSLSDFLNLESAVNDACAADGDETADTDEAETSGGCCRGNGPEDGAACPPPPPPASWDDGGGDGVRIEELRGRRKLAPRPTRANDWKKEGFLM